MKITKAYNFDLEKQKLEQFLIRNNNLIDFQNINEYIKHSLFKMSGGTLQKIEIVKYPAFIKYELVNNAPGEVIKQVQSHNLRKETLFNLENIYLYQIHLSPPMVNDNDFKKYRHISIRFTK